MQGDQNYPGIIPMAIKDVFSTIQDVSMLEFLMCFNINTHVCLSFVMKMCLLASLSDNAVWLEESYKQVMALLLRLACSFTTCLLCCSHLEGSKINFFYF